jgi:glycosyltransferase involved in cell wall biosynthesis
VWAKGYEDLIHAFGLLKSKRPNLFCVIIGSGELLSSLLEQITSSGLENRVFLLGQTDHVKALKILKSCDIFVMPSRTEGTPIALLEAASIGVPILATKVGGIPELLTDQDALLIPENSPTAIVDGLLKLTDDKEFAQALGRSAQKRVDNLFTVENQLDATLELYNKVLQN